MRVLVIPEDFRKDAWILEPVIGAMLRWLRFPRARVRVCRDPLLGGVSQATDWERLQEVFERYRGMVECFLLIVDRDGVEGRRVALDRLERLAAEDTRLLVAENAWQEIEVWGLAGQSSFLPGWTWTEIRAHSNPKEEYFEPYARERNLQDEPGAGRQTLGREAGQNYRRVRSRCREDIEALEQRVWEALTNGAVPAHPLSPQPPGGGGRRGGRRRRRGRRG